MRLPLPLSTYSQDRTRLLNVFMEVRQQGKTQILGRDAPGVAAFVDVGVGPFRGAAEWNDKLYVLSGTTLYAVTRVGAVATVGTVPGEGRMSMASNRLNLVTASGYYTDGSTVSLIADPDFVAGSDVDFLDNFLIFLRPDSDTFAVSELNSTTSFDALDFAVAESKPDKLVGILADHNQIVLGGSRSMELYWNSGSTGFPFERIPDGVVELGCLAGATMQPLDNSVIWLAADRTVRALRDRTPARISQHGVEKALQSYDNLSEAYAFIYTLDGHLCYVLQVPGVATWVFDATTQQWFERASLNKPDWNVQQTVEAWGKTWAFDANGRIGELTAAASAEWGETIRREWWYPTVYSDRRNSSHGRFESVMIPGVGLETGQGSDPQVGLDFSDDGGRNWINLPTRSLGKIGKTKTRQVWHQLGSSRDRVYRQWISDPVPMTLEDAMVEVSDGRF
jgi:hypothetical protein